MGVTTPAPPGTGAGPGTRQDREPRGWAQRWLRPLALASLLANMGIVLTGGAVRLTDSGLGCPTWPRCTEDSYTPRGALDMHAAIEFGNRMVTFLLAAIAVATLVAAWRVGRTAVTRLALLLALGVPAQAVLGGITVLTGLNPWTVSLHLLVSLAMISLAVVLLVRIGEPDTAARRTVPVPMRGLIWMIVAVGWAVFYLGTVVTGSGPYAGDAEAPRTGLDPRLVSQLHVDGVMLMLGLTVAVVFALRAVPAPQRARDAALLLLLVELGQGLIGFVQYFTGLPVVLVSFHLLGATLTAAAMTWLVLSTRERLPIGAA